ncbi:MAG: sce7726 family protein [Shimia sp.]|uniref:sce7726 family protein n=1 Tax=Shimia sp. TaxID=1954381 RepID=UPI003B8E0154
MGSSTTQIHALSRLFSAGVFAELANKGRSPLFARLLSESELHSEMPLDAKVVDVFEEAFARLRNGKVRSEYIYRAAIVNNILLGTHSLNSASMLTEFRIGKSKADLVILNGTGTAYEIKSERDNISRLAKQVSDYRKVFASTYVIAGSNHVESVSDVVPNSTGILHLSRWNKISTIRRAKETFEEIDNLQVLDSLRSKEAVQILALLDRKIPSVPNTQLRSALSEEFSVLDKALLHRTMVKALKHSRSLLPLKTTVNSLPVSLRAAALTFKTPNRQHKALIDALACPMVEARAWN